MSAAFVSTDGPVTPQQCRRVAADFYYSHLTGAQEDWITSGVDPEDARIDADVVALAALLWSTAQQACRSGVVS